MEDKGLFRYLYENWWAELINILKKQNVFVFLRSNSRKRWMTNNLKLKLLEILPLSVKISNTFERNNNFKKVGLENRVSGKKKELLSNLTVSKSEFSLS